MTTILQTISAPNIIGTVAVFVSNFDISISGAFVGLVYLDRSFDTGTTWHEMKSYLESIEEYITVVATASYRFRTDLLFSGSVVLNAIESTSGVTRELIVTTYSAKNAFTGASEGDVISCTQIIDTSGAPFTVSSIWRNQTTSTDLVTVPLATDLDLVGATALTDGQLRANPVEILGTTQVQALTTAPWNVSGPLTLAELQSTQIQALGTMQVSALTTAPWNVSGPLTLAELQSTQIQALGTMQVQALTTAPWNVSGPLTLAELQSTQVQCLTTSYVAALTTAPWPTIGSGFAATATTTRPGDTSLYTAGDIIGCLTTTQTAAMAFAGIGPVSGHIIITDADLRIDVAAVPTGMTTFRLHLYNITPPSALVDNAVWNLPAGDRDSYLGYIDLNTPVDTGDTLFVQMSGINKKLQMGVSTSLFGYLVTNGGYTPSASAVKAIRLNAVGL